MTANRNKYNLGDQVVILAILEVFLLLLAGAGHLYMVNSASGMEYDRPEWVWGLVLAPVLSLFYMWSVMRKNKRLSRLAEDHLLPAMSKDISSTRSLLKFTFFRLSIYFLVVALINPKVGTKLQVVKTEGQDIMICLDVSSSMKAEDIVPNRLERAKMALEQFFKQVHGDRVGVIVFAGEAYVQLPLTTDYEAAKLFLDGVDTEMMSLQGTAIGTAINLAMESFDWDHSGQKSIIIITDGENHEANTVAAAREAAEKGVIIHAIGMGTPQGGPIPITNRFGERIGFKKDGSGNTVVSALDENMLKKLVNEGNGIFIRASSSQVGLNQLMQELDNVEKEELDTFKYAEYSHAFPYFVGLAILCWVLEFLIAPKRRRWSKELSLLD